MAREMMVFLSSPSLELTKVCISMEEHTSPLSALVRDLDGGGCNGGGTLVFRVRIPQRDLPKSMSTGCTGVVQGNLCFRARNYCHSINMNIRNCIKKVLNHFNGGGTYKLA